MTMFLKHCTNKNDYNNNNNNKLFKLKIILMFDMCIVMHLLQLFNFLFH